LALLIVTLASNHLDAVIEVLSTETPINKSGIAALLDECIIDCWTIKYVFEVRGLPVAQYPLFANALSLRRALNMKEESERRPPIGINQFVEMLLGPPEKECLRTMAKMHSLIRQYAAIGKA